MPDVLLQLIGEPLPETPGGSRVVSRLEALRAGVVERDIARGLDDISERACLVLALRQLTKSGRVRWVVPGQATLVPTSREFELPARSPPVEELTPSRFAYVRRAEDGSLRLENPQALCRFELHDARLAGLCLTDASALSPALAGLLGRAGFLVPRGTVEAARWEFHDRLFHVRTRRGRHDAPMGATWRFGPEADAGPAVAPRPPGHPLALQNPPYEQLPDDPPFQSVVEARRSVREPGSTISLEALGELLWRTLRVRSVRAGDRDDVSSRPFPSAGARYPLEAYAAVGRCAGLAPGLYHYDAGGHALTRTRDSDPTLATLLEAGRVGTAPPQVLLVLAARFDRVAVKYESLAYALLLKEVGIVLQTLSLAAQAMGLGTCIVGNGDSDLFARAAGAAPETLVSVGELAVGAGA